MLKNCIQQFIASHEKRTFMYNKKLIALAILLSAGDINKIQARGNGNNNSGFSRPIDDDRFFHVGEEKKERKKGKKKKYGKRKDGVRAPYGDWASQVGQHPSLQVDPLPAAPVDPLPEAPLHHAVGQNSSTHAPRSFDPAPDLAGDGLVGNYFASNQTAMIHDPSQYNPTSYSFENVMAVTDFNEINNGPQGFIKIGSFMTSSACPAGVMCITAMKVTTLFGTLKK